ncbi:hypothetical protein SEA_MUSETTA_78 [Microbacterium phage Musetta]|nr:hypothetical protein SEA_FORK_74 [Microbacterium phage Fork]AXH50233.1 hypothetical protein SEA_MUSETTA_78 [Microbacterium phage Musetta]
MDEAQRFLEWRRDFRWEDDGVAAFGALEKLAEIREIAGRGGKGSLDEIRRALS